MAFVWDPKKDAENVREHHMHLIDAEPVFHDPFRMIRRDADSSVIEERYQTMGMAGKVLFVVYTEEGDDDTRIISARVADPKERRIYYGGNDQYGWERTYL